MAESNNQGIPMNNEQVQRAEIFMWGALACAQPWFAMGRTAIGSVWTGVALIAWAVARFGGR